MTSQRARRSLSLDASWRHDRSASLPRGAGLFSVEAPWHAPTVLYTPDFQTTSTAAPPHLLFCLTTAGTYPRLCRGGGLANHRRMSNPPPPLWSVTWPRRAFTWQRRGGGRSICCSPQDIGGGRRRRRRRQRPGTARHSRSISIPREIHRRGPPRPSELEMASSSSVSSAERRQRDGKLKQSKLLVLLLPPAHGPPPPPRATTSRASCNAGGTVQHSSRGGGKILLCPRVYTVNRERTKQQ